jgi:hypothetical protein
VIYIIFCKTKISKYNYIYCAHKGGGKEFMDLFCTFSPRKIIQYRVLDPNNDSTLLVIKVCVGKMLIFYINNLMSINRLVISNFVIESVVR